jgi:hypothetical protein
MGVTLASEASAAIAEIARRGQLSAVHVNGHGETTLMERWLELFS